MNSSSFVVGWADDSFAFRKNMTLQNAAVTIYPNSSCSAYQTSSMNDWNMQICAGDELESPCESKIKYLKKKDFHKK